MTGPRESLAGRVLDGRYRLEARIGGGGMGEVYRGRHLMMDQRVAVKVLRPDLTAEPTAAKRFTREARATFLLDHPHCIRVTDFGATDDGLLYLVMEYLDGRTVGAELDVDGPMAPGRVVRIARQVCQALECAHGLGLVHRDLKPDNIMLVRRGQDTDVVKVLDFGLAKLVTGPDGALTAAFSMSPLTREGMVFGTPEYMSPEQATEQPLSPQTDIYSLGVVMYEMLGGALPFRGDSFMAVLTMHVRDTPIPLSRRRPDLAVPAALDALVLACMAKEPAARPAGARDLAARLAELETALPHPAPRVAGHVAASSTVDLDARAVSQAAAAETVSLHDLPASGPPSMGHSAPTPGAPGRAHSAPTPGGARPAPEPRSRRVPRAAVWMGLALALALALAAGGGALLLGRGNSASDASGHTVQDIETKKLSMAPAEPARDRTPPPRPGATAPPERSSQTQRGDAGTADASGPAAAPRRRSRAERRARAHLRAARKARRAGNVLKQIAEADSALRLDPDSAEAAYLLGDALVGSDPRRGCDYLRRARRLKKARAAYRRAGCSPGN